MADIGLPQRTPVDTFDLLNQIVTILDPDTNNVHFWPFLASVGTFVESYGASAVNAPLDPIIVNATAALDAAVGFSPHKHPGGVHSYGLEAAQSPALVGADAASLSFDGTTDTAFSVGCFFLIQSGTGTLLSKYDVAGTAREWKLDFAAGPDLRFVLYDESATAEEGAQTTAALNLGQWYMGVGTYGGAGGAGGGEAGDDVALYVDGAVVADTDIDDATYVDMEDSAAPLMIGATDDKAAPASEFDGRIALPFIVNAQLSAANIAALYGLGRQLLGLT